MRFPLTIAALLLASAAHAQTAPPAAPATPPATQTAQQLDPQQIAVGLSTLSDQSASAWIQVKGLVVQLENNVATERGLVDATDAKVADRDKQIADLTKKLADAQKVSAPSPTDTPEATRAPHPTTSEKAAQ
jgi:hypothetical protein